MLIIPIEWHDGVLWNLTLCGFTDADAYVDSP